VKVGRDNFLIAQALLVMRRGRMRLLDGAANVLESCGLPAALLAVAAWDVCQPVQRKRSADKLSVESLAKTLVARYEGRVSITEARRLVADGLTNSEAWVSELASADRQSGDYSPPDARGRGLTAQFWKPHDAAGQRGPKIRGACPSTELELSRRMISYWRGHRLYGEARALVRRLWRDSGGD
jgi:hypothetical protein